MLEEYKNEQPVAYKVLKNAIATNKISHAYIFETNGYKNKNEFSLAFAKALLCPNHGQIQNEKCTCNVCTQIDNNEFLELKIIDVDGNIIKKSDMDELQKEFANKPILGNRKVYIIHNADKMNASSSNSILKFLEEPEEGIVAILMVDNIYQLLDTIISRCQIIKLNKNQDDSSVTNDNFLSKISQILKLNNDKYQEFINDENNEIKIRQIVDFVKNIETNTSDAFVSETTKLSSFLTNSSDVQFALLIILAFYKDVINYKLDLYLEFFTNDYLDDIKKISSLNTINKLCNKINILLKLRTEYKINANSNLLIDRLIIEFNEV